jgi:hypothetical protein
LPTVTLRPRARVACTVAGWTPGSATAAPTQNVRGASAAMGPRRARQRAIPLHVRFLRLGIRPCMPQLHAAAGSGHLLFPRTRSTYYRRRAAQMGR